MTNTVTTHDSEKASRFSTKRFLKDTSGVSGLMMGLSAIPILMIAGIALDTAMITREQATFYQSVDNAALAVASNEQSVYPIGFSEEQKVARKNEMIAYAKRFLDNNYKELFADQDDITVDLELTGQRVKMDVELKFPSLFSSIFSNDAADGLFTTLKSSTTVERAMRPVEMALVLDTTGSMKNDMVALKNAANRLISAVYADPSTTSKNPPSHNIRMSLVPFSGAVRLNPNGFDFNQGWIDTTGVNPLSHINFTDPTWNNFNAWGRLRSNATTPHVWNGCVEARKQNVLGVNYITQDISPNITNPESLFPAYFNPDSPSWYPLGHSRVTKYHTDSGTYQSGTSYWNNEYIYPAYAYDPSASGPNVLAPSGSQRTGFDDSVIGRNNTNFATRFTNQNKYINKNIGSETLTLSGDGVTWNSSRGPWVNCTATPVVPMTYNRANIEAGIGNMKAYGGTNIAEGLAWGMRTLSPTAPFQRVQGVSGSIPEADISGYNDVRWQKFLVLMTDGQNDPYVGNGSGPIQLRDTGTSYNSFGFSNTTTTGDLNRYGSTNFANADNALDGYTTTMCNQLKASGVTIYTIGFRVNSSLMQSCASEGKYYFANNPTDLVAYFDGIGRDVLNKMVYISK